MRDDQHPGTSAGGVAGAGPGATLEVRRGADVVIEHKPGRADEPDRRVAVLLVTWNRKGDVERVLRSIARQTYGSMHLDVVVVDNAGTDGTFEHLRSTFAPEIVIDNDTPQAHEPNFRVRPSESVGNRLGVAGFTLVRNTANMGGCGGFNTGFAVVDRVLSARPAGGAEGGTLRPAMVWLVDDDADVPEDALERLASTMASDPDIGLVGSRTVDIVSREATIETTIYYNDHTGLMQPTPPPHHAHVASYRAWMQRAKAAGAGGAERYTGAIDVDVASACSALARWDAVVGGPSDRGRAPVGFWDYRYFIYCDDADWSLRFKAAGWRVVLCADARVFHTPWSLKLTPARIYYANRNRIWMGQKAISAERRGRVLRKSMRWLLKDALRAALHRRPFHADIILQTAVDVVIGRWGKTGSDGPPAENLTAAMGKAGVLRDGASVAVLCGAEQSLTWFNDLRAAVETDACTRGVPAPKIRWIPVVRNTVAKPWPEGTIEYGGRRMSRLKKQLWMLTRRADACVVFEHVNDFPVLTPLGPAWNIHIDPRKPGMAQVERDTWGVRLAFIARWIPAAVRCLWWATRAPAYVRTGRYG